MTDFGILIHRLSLSILMLLHGIAKLEKGVSPIESLLAKSGIPEIIAYGVYIGEVVAPLLLIIGYRTRIAALIFAVNCLVAMFLVHSDEIFTITKTGGWGVELLGLYLFGSIVIFLLGPGKFAIANKNFWS